MSVVADGAVKVKVKDMTQEEKDLLLKDLCARLPYDVKIQGTVYEDILDNYGEETGTVNEEIVTFILYIIGKDSIMYDGCWIPLESCKPYLRPMSSMTKEEKEDFKYYYQEFEYDDYWHPGKYAKYVGVDCVDEIIDWLNKHHFDYRGLIGKGLALEASEKMYSKQ